MTKSRFSLGQSGIGGFSVIADRFLRIFFNAYSIFIEHAQKSLGFGMSFISRLFQATMGAFEVFSLYASTGQGVAVFMIVKQRPGQKQSFCHDHRDQKNNQCVYNLVTGIR